MVCSARRHSAALAAALAADTAEAQTGKPDTASSRRTRPRARDAVVGHAPSRPWRAKTDCMASSGSSRWSVNPTPTARKLPASLARHCAEKQASHFSLDLFAGKSPASERFWLSFAMRLNRPLQSGSSASRAAVRRPPRGPSIIPGPAVERAFVAVDCVALQPFLVESLLFGLGGLLSSGHGWNALLEGSRRVAARSTTAAGRSLHGNREPPRLISGSPRAAPDEVAAGRLVSEFHTALSVLELRSAAASGTDGRPGEVHFIPPSRSEDRG